MLPKLFKMKKYLFTILILASLVLTGCLSKPQINQNTAVIPGPPSVIPDSSVVIPAEAGIQQAATTTEEIDTSDWKTYRNEEYGFEFKYPDYYEADSTYSVWNDSYVSSSTGLLFQWGVNKGQETIFSISVYPENQVNILATIDESMFGFVGETVVVNNIIADKLHYLRILVRHKNHDIVIYSSFMDYPKVFEFYEYKNILETVKFF